MVDYILLPDTARTTVRERLAREHKYFYHFTLDQHASSIKQFGLDPRFEGDDSSYPNRDREPSKAIRYCTEQNLALGLSAASTRQTVWDPSAEMHVPGPARIILLRTPANCLLEKPFGLDHSFSDAARSAEQILQTRPSLSADEFHDIVTRFGAVSCYAVIPPTELEICIGDVAAFCHAHTGDFSPLLQQG